VALRDPISFAQSRIRTLARQHRVLDDADLVALVGDAVGPLARREAFERASRTGVLYRQRGPRELYVSLIYGA